MEGHKASQDSATNLTFLHGGQKISPEQFFF